MKSLLPIQGSWQRPWCVPSGTGRYPCWQTGGGEGPPAALDPSNMATSPLSEWHTWVRHTQQPKVTFWECVWAALLFQDERTEMDASFQEARRIKLTSSETYWRLCGTQIQPFLLVCFPAVPGIQPDAWP